jgi:hypothetical protein
MALFYSMTSVVICVTIARLLTSGLNQFIIVNVVHIVFLAPGFSPDDKLLACALYDEGTHAAMIIIDTTSWEVGVGEYSSSFISPCGVSGPLSLVCVQIHPSLSEGGMQVD